jgi:NADH dehydrogenase
MKQKIATVFGGTGFVGTQVVRKLAKRGYTIKVATRIPEKAYFLRPCGTVGQIVPFACDYSEASIQNAVSGAEVVVNCVGTLFDRKKKGFQKAHTEFPASIARACAQQGVTYFIHISAAGVDVSTSKYAQSKREGEQAVLENFPYATILRPSVIFGENDNFFNMFAKMAAVFPALPLIGGGKTQFQPVYVGDVAEAVMAVIDAPVTYEETAMGKVYELGGPEIVNFRQIYERMFEYTRQPRRLVNLPFGLAKMQAGLMGILPKPP